MLKRQRAIANGIFTKEDAFNHNMLVSSGVLTISRNTQKSAEKLKTLYNNVPSLLFTKKKKGPRKFNLKITGGKKMTSNRKSLLI